MTLAAVSLAAIPEEADVPEESEPWASSEAFVWGLPPIDQSESGHCLSVVG
jgi:hypothetical protein